MRKIIDYKVIVSKDKIYLEAEVKKHLITDWCCKGGVCISDDVNTFGLHFAQAIVKYGDEMIRKMDND